MCVNAKKARNGPWPAISLNSNIRSSISFTLSSPNGANGLLSLTRRRLSIPAVSPHPKIEADEWEPPAPQRLRYLCHRLIVPTFTGSFTLFSIRQRGAGQGAKTDAHQFRIHVASQGSCTRGWVGGCRDPDTPRQFGYQRWFCHQACCVSSEPHSVETSRSFAGPGQRKSYDMSLWNQSCEGIPSKVMVSCDEVCEVSDDCEDVAKLLIALTLFWIPGGNFCFCLFLGVNIFFFLLFLFIATDLYCHCLLQYYSFIFCTVQFFAAVVSRLCDQ